jgi:hypothetical protein
VDCVLTHRLNSLWSYDQERTLTKCVPLQFYPIIKAWIKNANTKNLSGAKSYYLYQVVGASAIFTYASTTQNSNATGVRAGLSSAGARSVSVNADVLFMEERSQYPPGTADPLRYRLSASRLPVPLIRELGTPGGGQGIETELVDCEVHFYPHANCGNCGHLQVLNPFGCLLKPRVVSGDNGNPETAFLSKTGRPMEWFHSDPLDPVTSAFFGCSECGSEIDRSARVNARMYCIKTGVSIGAFLDNLNDGIPSRNIKAAFHISPVPRDTHFNNAAQLIKTGLEVINTNDWCQQGLGWASVTKTEGLTRELLERAMCSPTPDRKPDLIFAGIDQGRQQDWLSVIQVWLPTDWRSLKPIQVVEQSIRKIVYMSDILRDDIPRLLSEHDVDLCLMDNEPSRKEAIKLSEEVHCLDIVDQTNRLPDLVRHQVVADGGIYASCWLIESKTFMTEILSAFQTLHADGHPLYRLPDWSDQFASQTELSPITHLTSPYRNSLGVWERGRVNDLFSALHFAEAAFYIRMNGLKEANPGRKAVLNLKWKDHLIGGDDALDYAYNPKLTVGLSFSSNDRHYCAIAFQEYQGTKIIVAMFDSRLSQQDLVLQVANWVGANTRQIRIYGSPDNDWLLIWQSFNQSKISAYKCYSGNSQTSADIAKAINGYLAKSQLLLLSPECEPLYTAVGRSVWKGENFSEYPEWINCMGYILLP